MVSLGSGVGMPIGIRQWKTKEQPPTWDSSAGGKPGHHGLWDQRQWAGGSTGPTSQACFELAREEEMTGREKRPPLTLLLVPCGWAGKAGEDRGL